jgi:hypothetical protein
MDAGRVSEACAKFRISDALDPEVGTKMNLARCYDRLGTTASAYAAWGRAAEAAARQARIATDPRERQLQSDREIHARAQMAALAPRLLYLSVRVEGGIHSDVTVLLDGEALPKDQWDLKIPVDPGVHQLVGLAPLREPWFAHFELDEQRSPWIVVSVPDLRERPPQYAHAQADGPPEVDPLRTTAIGLGAAALVTGLVGVGFGIDSLSAYSRALSNCTPSFNCNDSGMHDLSRLRTDAAVADVTLVVAGLEAVGAVTLWWMGARKARAATVGAAYGGRTAVLTIGGTW